MDFTVGLGQPHVSLCEATAGCVAGCFPPVRPRPRAALRAGLRCQPYTPSITPHHIKSHHVVSQDITFTTNRHAFCALPQGQLGGPFSLQQPTAVQLLSQLPEVHWTDWIVDPGDIEFCCRPDGSYQELGAGAFGKVGASVCFVFFCLQNVFQF